MAESLEAKVADVTRSSRLPFDDECEREQMLALLREEGERTRVALDTIAQLARTVCQLSTNQSNGQQPVQELAPPQELDPVATNHPPPLDRTISESPALVVISYQTAQLGFMKQLVRALDAAGIASVDGTKTPPGTLSLPIAAAANPVVASRSRLVRPTA